MKIQISPTRRIPDMFTIWFKPGPEVDLVIDPRDPYGIKFRPGFVEVIYAFGVLGHSEEARIIPMLKQWVSTLKEGGELYIVEQDFEYLSRAIVGGDLKIEEFNQDFRFTTYLTPEKMSRYMEEAGFPTGEQREWYDPPLFKKQHFEKILSGTKKK